MRQFRQFLKRLIHKPRLRWLKELLGPYFLSGDPHNQWLRVVMNREN
jgi:hypothetical protein